MPGHTKQTASTVADGPEDTAQELRMKQKSRRLAGITANQPTTYMCSSAAMPAHDPTEVADAPKKLHRGCSVRNMLYSREIANQRKSLENRQNGVLGLSRLQ